MEEENKTIQAVILAAGRGTRMLPLTEERPKPLQVVSGKNLIEWKLEALPDVVREVIMIIGYQGDQIRAFFGDVWKGKPIRYVVQEELNGTAGALWAARDLLHGRFLVLMGDDLYAQEDIATICREELAIGVQKITRKEIGGEMIANAEGNFAGIIEEKHYVEDGLQNAGFYMLDERVFGYPLTPIGGSSTEFGLPHTLVALAKTLPIRMILVTKWLQVTTPEDLVRAEAFVKSNTILWTSDVQSMKDSTSVVSDKATFAMGCFWSPDDLFHKVHGVLDTVAGYTGGTKDNPTYEEVCTGNTGHAEAVEITFDPGKITYEQLLDIFWKNHNPTTIDKQGPDVGAQYRSAIFFHSLEQEKVAHASKERIERSGIWGASPVVTAIVPAVTFWRAEDYHQQYFAKRGMVATCHI